MAGRERSNKGDQRGYAGDIWGNELAAQPPTGQRRRKGKTVIIDGVPHVQQNLFSGEALRVPFPEKPVNHIPDRLGATPTPGTLFEKPEEERQETQPALFSPPAEASTAPVHEGGKQITPEILQKSREETREYVPLSVPTFYMLALQDGRVTHFVPAIVTDFDKTWNIALLRPLFAASSINRGEAVNSLQAGETLASEQGQLHDIQVFARPEEETRVKTSPLNYLQFIMHAYQGEESVFLSGELQPSRSDPEIIALVGYSAIITPDYQRLYDYIQGQLRRNALAEEQPIQEDRPVLRRFLQAMRGSEVPDIMTAHNGHSQDIERTSRRRDKGKKTA